MLPEKRDYAIPKAIFKRIIKEIISDQRLKHQSSKCEKKALELLHYVSEEYMRDIFMVSGLTASASKRHTVTKSHLMNAIKIHSKLIHH
jgi:histone H3/H4